LDKGGPSGGGGNFGAVSGTEADFLDKLFRRKSPPGSVGR